MKKELLTNESLDSGLMIKLRKNTLLDDGSLIANVSSKTATVKSTLTAIKNDGTVADISLMLRHLQVYQDKLLQLLGQGYTVKLLDIGLLRIKHKGKIKNASNAASDISQFTLGFTPSKDALDSVKELSVDAILQPEIVPVIEEVADVFRGEKDGFVTSGEPVSVTGMRLKLGEENDRLCFVPQTESGQNVDDESRWIEVDHARIFRNKPSELTFFAPTNLAEGVKYRVRIETSYLGKAKSSCSNRRRARRHECRRVFMPARAGRKCCFINNKMYAV